MSALIERIKAANRRKARICRGEQRRRFGQRFGGWGWFEHRPRVISSRSTDWA